MTDNLVKGHIEWLRGDHEHCNPMLADRIEALEAKLAKVTAAYRREAMRRDDYSHEAFDLHLTEITGETDG